MKTENDIAGFEQRGRDNFHQNMRGVDREVDVRERDSFYDLPDYDAIDVDHEDGRKLHLKAPPPRVDPKWGRMVQYWCAFRQNNGRRLQEMMDRGYRVRRPETVPISFTGMTEKWEGRDVIMVADELILMEMPESHYNKVRMRKHEANNQRMRDIRNTNGDIIRPLKSGGTRIIKDPNASGEFHQPADAQRNMEGDIHFDD